MLPLAFETRMKEMLGEEYPAFLAGYEKENHQSLRLNPLKIKESTEKALFQMKTQIEGLFTVKQVPWEPKGFYYDHEDRPGKHPLHDAGVYYIQEASAMLPVRLLDPRPGEYVLDLCAAPGGKSTQIAGALQGEGLLVSNEIHPARAKILSENIERLGVSNALVTNEDAQKLLHYFPGFFDRILVDAPCSGEGMFRKNEEAVGEWSLENVELCAKRQREILDCAAAMLAPGGRLVYSTCTFAPAENEETIQWFLEHHPEFSFVEIPKKYYEMVNYPEGKDGMLRIYPHRTEGEGHFMAVLQKEGENPEKKTDLSHFVEPAKKSKNKKKEPDGMQEFEAFCQDTLQLHLEELFPNREYITFGEQLYLKPEGITTLMGLKVMRPGLHIGTMKKGRFEPSHALALALKPSQVKHFANLKSSEVLVHQYLNGQTFSMEGEKGWYVIGVDGYSLGWGKLAGGIMKNHYPKGLRTL